MSEGLLDRAPDSRPGCHVLVTGAAGFVGQALVHRLLATDALPGRRVQRLSLVDRAFSDPAPADPRVRRWAGDLGDAQAWGRGLAELWGDGPVDLCFHLASVPGGAAEAQPDLARRVNLDATLQLMDACRQQVLAGAAPPVLVFASSVAVFGALPAQAVHEDHPPRPLLSYGAHKLAAEVLLDDHDRRGWLQARSLRLPGVLARPPAPTGQLSAFLSDGLRALVQGQPFVWPMGPQASTWASSLPNTLDNLLHAAHVPTASLGGRRCFTLPTQCFTLADLVQAGAQRHGLPPERLAHYAPQPALETLFGRMPTLLTPAAEAAGFSRDADLATLLQRAVDGAPR